MIEKTQNSIILSPFKTEFFKDIQISLLLIVGGGVAGFFLENQQYKGIAWGLAIIGVGFILYHLIFSKHQKVIFDLQKRIIYVKNWWGERSLLPFSEATLLCQSNNHGSQSYHLAKKSDRYRSLKRISGYLSESELQKFENEVISVIAPFLENQNISQQNEQSYFNP